ncbi:hypothetical protein ANCCAN_13876 [Ancylostoma caninum]|uniref:Uncharacterized protein n=1 Tax=Ancylostoma caninum TaxID=29170 RepID=A0A368G6X6_ANCCA|nr:hypothetical protein ANCCAN_13876 [Ancylostoma caninum]
MRGINELQKPPSCEPDSVHLPDLGPHHPPLKLPDAGPRIRTPPGHPRGDDEHHERSIFNGLPPNPKPFFGPVGHIDDYDR